MVKDMRDPVCGMRVDPERSRFSSEHGGKVYHFCCGGCLATFNENPTQFLQQDSGALRFLDSEQYRHV